MSDNKPLWTPFMLTLLIVNAIIWPANSIRNAIDVNTCIAAQGKYLDETDFEDCGYKP